MNNDKIPTERNALLHNTERFKVSRTRYSEGYFAGMNRAERRAKMSQLRKQYKLKQLPSHVIRG